MFRQFNIIILSLFFIQLTDLPPIYSGEYSITGNSTVIGRNYGYPSGTPQTGHTEVGNLDLVVESTIYAKNLEIFHVDVDGGTYVGFLTPLRLRYRPHNQITIEAGELLGYDFGDGDTFDELEPIFRFVYEPYQDTFFIAGSIIRTHPVHDALYDDTAAFNENTEQGFQFRADLETFKQDLWINWRVKETEKRSERFDSASVTQFRAGDLHLDAQVFIRHTGGQKNAEHIVDYNFSYLFGASYGFFREKSVPVLNNIDEIRIGGWYLCDNDMPDNDSDRHSSSGSGIEGKVEMIFNPSEDVKASLFASHFNGNDLFAKAGDPLYAKDEYSQLGTNFLFNLPAGCRIETAIIAQQIDGTFAYGFQVYFSWGKGFTVARGI